MTDFTTSIVLNHSPKEIYAAIINVGRWWDGEIKGAPSHVGDEFEYQMKEFHYSKQRVTEMVPETKIAWLVIDSSLSFTKKKNEWTGTKLIFEIFQNGGQTQLRFTHSGLNPTFECFDACSGGWSDLIQKSLYNLITKGEGVAVFSGS